MPIAGRTSSTPNDARTVEASVLLLGAGAIVLFVSLFLDWYRPGVDAWTAFEAWDLVLAVLAFGMLVAVASRIGYGPPRPASWALGPALAALVIVLSAILDPPPATAGLPDGDPATGLWLALVAAALMTTGAVLSVAHISVAITTTDPAFASRAPEGRRSRRFVRGDAPAVDDPAEPLAPTDPTRRL